MLETSPAAFNLVFQRRSPMFKAIVVTPAIVIVIMTLVSFWLPPQAGEKLLLNGVACIVICILLMYFSQLLPILSASSPLIGTWKFHASRLVVAFTVAFKLIIFPTSPTVTFYSHTLYLLCFSLIISVIVINMSRNRKQCAVPRLIKANILDGFIGKLLAGASHAEPSTVENHSEELRETPFEEHLHSDDHQIIQTPAKTTSKSHGTHNEWIRLAVIVDRATFFVYVFVFIGMGFLHFI